MAPGAWSLRAVEGLAAGLPQPAGLLLGTIDEAGRAVTLLGAAPAPAAGSAKDVAAAAAKLLDLMPYGVHVVGSYGCQPPPGAAPHGCPAVGLQPAGGGGGAFTLGGAAAAAEAVAAPGAGLAPDGFVMLRVHCDLLLRVICPPAGPTPQALAHAFVEAAQQLAGPQLAFVSEPRRVTPRRALRRGACLVCAAARACTARRSAAQAEVCGREPGGPQVLPSMLQTGP
ncbi:MAG: hypothetical protein J3K34DRAFT_32644 [Monoraphidium minutum]|nr:MAG: hypothetical protein J3K34DRAFT_32644 [Monoraphidium minutum]